MRAGEYSGNSGEMFIAYHDGAMFSTYDSDNDSDATRNCAAITGGGFWWKTCAGTLGVTSVNTQISGGFGCRVGSTNYPMLISRMWLTC